MSIDVIAVGEAEVKLLEGIGEGQFSETKATEVSPSKMAKGLSAFANTDGSDVYVGIDECLLAAASRSASGVGSKTWKQQIGTSKRSNDCFLSAPVFSTSFCAATRDRAFSSTHPSESDPWHRKD